MAFPNILVPFARSQFRLMFSHAQWINISCDLLYFSWSRTGGGLAFRGAVHPCLYPRRKNPTHEETRALWDSVSQAPGSWQGNWVTCVLVLALSHLQGSLRPPLFPSFICFPSPLIHCLFWWQAVYFSLGVHPVPCTGQSYAYFTLLKHH